MDSTTSDEWREKIEHELSVHDAKFADNPHHAACKQRFKKVLSMLHDQDHICSPRLDQSISESALPDALADAARLQQDARLLGERRDARVYELHKQAQQIVSKELNELDGFDR